MREAATGPGAMRETGHGSIVVYFFVADVVIVIVIVVAIVRVSWLAYPWQAVVQACGGSVRT